MILASPATKSLVLQVDDPLFFRGLFPTSSKILPHPDFNLAVKHTLDNTKVLRNLGFDAPSPMSSQYNFPGKFTPFEHQRVMGDFLTLVDKGFNLSDMGTAKTAPALWAADYLMNVGAIKRCLIVTPIGTMRDVWQQGIFDVLMHRTCGIVHGSIDKRMKMLNSDLDFYILNHDGLALQEVAREVRRRRDIDLVIIDEVGEFRNSKTDKYAFIQWIMEKKTRLWALTGTPCSNAPTDAWALARLVDPSKVPQWFGSFQRATMTKVEITRKDGTCVPKWVPQKGGLELAYKALQPAVRFKKSDCLSLPPVTTQKFQTRMTVEQLKHFKAMRDDMIIQTSQGSISAQTAADKILKLRQLLCGAIKDPKTGDYITIDHSHRFNDLVTLIKSAAAKSIIVVPFKGIIRALDKELRDAGYNIVTINGDVTAANRTKRFIEFKQDPSVIAALCHPEVMAHGLNLTEADYTIFYAPIYSNDQAEQVVTRMDRPGQTRKMTIVRMGAHPIEWGIYEAVATKSFNQQTILNLFDTVTH